LQITVESPNVRTTIAEASSPDALLDVADCARIAAKGVVASAKPMTSGMR
jgi:hypothetical protein